jgi:DNA invertase Pin-like site-specific DNA recombinase
MPRGRPPGIAAAEAKLRRWTSEYVRRDEAVREAAAAGVSVHRIHEITGIARTTITRIIREREADQ